MSYTRPTATVTVAAYEPTIQKSGKYPFGGGKVPHNPLMKEKGLR